MSNRLGEYNEAGRLVTTSGDVKILRVKSDGSLNRKIVTDDIADGAITADKLSPDIDLTNYITKGNVTTSDIKDNSVTTDKVDFIHNNTLDKEISILWSHIQNLITKDNLKSIDILPITPEDTTFINTSVSETGNTYKLSNDIKVGTNSIDDRAITTDKLSEELANAINQIGAINEVLTKIVGEVDTSTKDTTGTTEGV